MLAICMLLVIGFIFPRCARTLFGIEVDLGGTMRDLCVAAAVALACTLCAVAPAKGDNISTTLGNATPGFAAGTKQSAGTIAGAVSGNPAPFNAPCGSDSFSNCSTSWTFNYTVPSGDTITGATLSLGIFDIDSAAPGNQVGSFTLDGTANLTGILNTASEGLEGGTGSKNSYYEVLSITIPGADLSDLSDDSATFALTLSGPGLGILGTTPFNGAELVYSTLDITAKSGTKPPPLPEPSSLGLLLGGLGVLGLKALFSR